MYLLFPHGFLFEIIGGKEREREIDREVRIRARGRNGCLRFACGAHASRTGNGRHLTKFN